MASSFRLDSDSLRGMKAKEDTTPNGETENDVLRKRAFEVLGEIGSLTVQDDAVQFIGDKVVLPKRFSGDLLSAAQFLRNVHKQEEEPYEFGRKMRYRPWDGAAAFSRATKRVFGTAGLGRVTPGGLFSPDQPPQLISIPTGINSHIQVPWGEVEIPALESTFTLKGMKDPEYGLLFYLSVVAPRRNRAHLEAFFDVVEEELRERSIYRGKAFNGAVEPEFLDLSGVKEEEVVYSNETLRQLEANVWAPIKYTAQHRKLGLPLKRAILLEGPYGTGKSLAGALTAQIAEKNGWTFILARPGKDDLFEVLNTARLYAPAVVQFEDIDVVAKGGSDEDISRLLDALDGIGNKGSGVVALFTTNFVEKIQRAVMRPGRIDSVIHIGKLDSIGVQKLIRSVVDPSVLSDNIDFEVVYSQMTDFLPAFVKEATDRAVRYSLSRNFGTPARIETDDLVSAAIELQGQLNLMNGAKEGADKPPTVDSALREVVADVIDSTRMLDYDGDKWGNLEVKQ